MTLILTFGSVSGAHFNPALTLADASQGGIRGPEVPDTSRLRRWVPCLASGRLT